MRCCCLAEVEPGEMLGSLMTEDKELPQTVPHTNSGHSTAELCKTESLARFLKHLVNLDDKMRECYE